MWGFNKQFDSSCFIGILILIIAALSPLQSSGQRCWDVRDESIKKFLSFYKLDQPDSISHLIRAWEDKCEVTEELFRLTILDIIGRHGDLNEILDSNSIGHIRSFMSKDLESLIPFYFSFTYESYESNEEFNEVTKAWARSLNSTNSLEAAFIELYGSGEHDPIWKLLKRNQGTESNLQIAFDKIVSESKNESEFYFGANFGGFYHFKSSQLAPQIGIQIGKINGSSFGMFSTFFRSGRSKQIEVSYKQQKELIGIHSLYLGYDFGRIKKFHNYEYSTFLSVSNTHFLTRVETEGNEKIVPAVGSLGIGFTIDWPVSDRDFLGIELRATPLNMNYKKDISFDAVSISLGIRWSLRNSRIKNEFLQPIGFYD